MFKSIIALALLATATTVSAGGMQVCTGKGGCIEKQITKDCCAAVGDQNGRLSTINL
ncbi:hypothetical protein WALSEDRAFT_33429 [Wallemia mellicola CBS 633.66]|uniref:Uncharacterized protein n=1 Tax=Wallemia mellicola (strain ATCC MYA-4683 / CBS 633.66) TaxID=671144 RepID=I4Y8V3_WALMC|nr:hypothetical protein WALSEDRAFT_33429 [Wallemia mellicola CBS 633.66]EIM20395.1 hypothetical protein WALSEDRAFT_33429 [Wallemia mellicola CBS 633.66]|eukprot:XP_006959651.1 hypothetical protein WALSEDRAFT_33429 [Wallemia mellicola CBS 633.66]